MQRLVIVLLYDPLGRLDRGMQRYLEALRPHASRLHLVVNGALDPASRALAGRLVHQVLERPNEGFDVGAYRAAIDDVGPRRLARFGELVLTNGTNFGPVETVPGRGASFDAVFERMSSRDVDVWGMTEHGELTPNPYTFRGSLPAHLQSNWLAVRARVLQSDAWAEYWESMPPIESYDDSVRHHEARFTTHFTEAGFRAEAVFPAAQFGVPNASIERPLDLLRAGCPIVKRRLFFHDPVELDHRAVDAPEVARALADGGFGTDLVIDSLALTTPPRVLAGAIGGVRTMREPVAGLGAIKPQTGLITAGDVLLAGGLRVRRVEGDFWRRLADAPDRLLVGVDLIVTRGAYPVLGAIPPAEEGALALEAGAHEPRAAASSTPARPDAGPGDRAADPSAIRAMRDAVRTLLGDPSPVSWLFADDPAVGLIVPLSPHLGTDVLGHGWLGRQEAAATLASRLGIEGPLDDTGPAAPFSAIAAYRVEALRPLAQIFRVQGGWAPLAATTHGGGPELERLLDLLASRLVLSAGFTTVEAGTTKQLETSLAHLQQKHAEMAGMLPPGVREPIRFLRARRRGVLSPEAIGETLVRRAPKFAQSLRAAIARWRG